MSTRSLPSPRKKPRQARAQATVDAILEGTIRILEQEGLDAATTTRIAEVAGVSVGTLYQYFSHRDAILDFEPGADRIDLSLIDADATRGGSQAFRFLGTARLDGEPAALTHRSGTVSGDTDGDGRADFRIDIGDGKHLTEDDFLL